MLSFPLKVLGKTPGLRGGQKGHVDCQAPHSDELLQTGGSLQSWLSPETLRVPGSGLGL